MKNRKIINTISTVLGIFVLILIVYAIYSHVYPLSWGIHSKVNRGLLSGDAINGYDPISYFTEKKAVKGNENLTFGYNDATWYFSSEENLNLFKSDPAKYSPQFGGYCALAVSKGFSGDSDPEAFEIIEGKLYLFADTDFKDKWLNQGASGIQIAMENWK